MFDARTWSLAHGRSLTLGPAGHLMGILNVTPDSFSDGGALAGPDAVRLTAARMAAEGASILDIGGESTRPGASPVDAATEQARVLAPIGMVRETCPDLVISIDTYRAGTARLAIEAGAHVVNDVWGLQREPDIARVAADTGAGICIMHTGRDRETLADVIEDQRAFFGRSLEIAARAGIEDSRIVLDPGFGFAKDAAQNFALMARFRELQAFGFPILAGASRKRFIGEATGRAVDERDVATAAATALLRAAGAAVLRVHDVAINRDALAIADAMIAAGRAE